MTLLQALVVMKVVELVLLTAAITTLIYVVLYIVIPAVTRLKTVLTLIEGNVTVIDIQKSVIVQVVREVRQQANMAASQAMNAAQEVKHAVNEVPDKVVEKITGTSGTLDQPSGLHKIPSPPAPSGGQK